MVRVSKDWEYRGMKALILENSRIRVTLLPEAGGRVFQFIDKAADADLLWHNPRREPEPVVLGSPGADLWWSGGIDDIFPTDFPCEYRNEQLPYLGELWTNAWDFQLSEDTGRAAELVLRTRTVISPFEVEKRVRLCDGDGGFSVRYSIRHIGFAPYGFYFGVHPGVTVVPGSRLLFPIRRAVIDDTWPAGVLAAKGTEYAWPDCPAADGKRRDLSVCPGPEQGWWTFHYGREVTEGLLAVLNPELGNAYCTSFDPSFFPYLHFYLGYGGWRNLYSIIPQIATSWPASLAAAVAAGTHRTLGPGEAARTEVGFHCLTGVQDEKSLRSALKAEAGRKA